MVKTLLYTLLALALAAVSGCTRGIPKQVLSNVDPAISFNMLITDPSAYTGKTVMAGGEIITSANTSSGVTKMEIMQLPLDSDDKPEHGDQSGGRFIATYSGYLETHIFSPGRNVTVVGVVAPPHKGTIGSMPYVFPVIHATYIKLWPRPSTTSLPAYSIGWGVGYGPGFYPSWGFYPYGPFWY